MPADSQRTFLCAVDWMSKKKLLKTKEISTTEIRFLSEYILTYSAVVYW